MDELSRLFAAQPTGEARPRASHLERGIVFVAISAFFGIACAFVVVGFLGLAVFFAAVPHYGDVRAACLAALAAAIVMAVLGFSAYRYVQPTRQAPERPSPLSSAAQATPPKTIWDIVALVVAGVAAGLSQAQKR